MREGLTPRAVDQAPDPSFDSQTKSKLVSERGEGIVDSVVPTGSASFLEENPDIGRQITEKRCSPRAHAMPRARPRDVSARRARMSSLPIKLADCQEKDPALSEIYIVG